MRRVLVSLLLVVLFTLTFCLTLHSRAAAPQSSSTPDSAANDSQTLQALLREVRELRQDLRAATVASGRAQILLTRLQAQQQAVTTAQKELDDAHTQLLRAETRRNNIENQIKYYSDQDNEDSTPDATKRQSLEQNIQRLKGVLQEVDPQRDSAQASETQAKQQLQLEQSKLDALQSELDQIDRALAKLASRPVN
jgi:chromosome segregation ATPase